MSVIIRLQDLERRRRGIPASPDLVALEAHLRRSVAQLLERPVYVPESKALLSRFGSLCRDDGGELGFDPWSPYAQRCAVCGRIWSTEQSHRWWVYWYQLWLAERLWLLALLGSRNDQPDCTTRAVEILAALLARYLDYPNADNVLGPSRPFFSTYLESVWVLQLAAAASLLRAAGQLPADLERDLASRLFRPSAALIADFDERGSNRQVWNAAALFALGRVLGDQPMCREAAHGPSGILASLDAGLLGDGLWYEGENYHWFALRGLVWGAEMLRIAGEADLWSDAGDRGRRFRAAFWAPVLTALPDFTSPARRDSKFGVSLRQRRMAELWELALARNGTPELASLLAHVYDAAVPPADQAWREVTEVERHEPTAGVRRSALGWKALLWMVPELPAAAPDCWRPGRVHLDATGLAIFRRDQGRTYVSLDYGEPGGPHAHPDRLNLTVHAGGIPWLVPFGTGSYVAPSLAWYRATLAHNAPLVDGLSQASARGGCVAYHEAGEYGWVCAQLPDGTAYDGAALQRTVVVTPAYLLDVVQMVSAVGERTLALAWHGLGRVTADELGVRFERPEGSLRVLLSARQPFHVEITSGPGPAVGTAPPMADLQFPVVVSTGEEVTLAACVDLSDVAAELECVNGRFLVRLTSGALQVHEPTEGGWRIDLGHGDPIELGGVREEQLAAAQLAAAQPPSRPGARCLSVARAPALDGMLEGFRPGAPLWLDRADQFRRAEEPWRGPEEFSARAHLNCEGSTIYLAVEVTAPHPAFRAPGAPDPELENENPDIHGDSLQVYVETTSWFGWVIVPNPDDQSSLRVAAVRGTDAEPAMITRGSWRPTARGYRVTLAIELPESVTGFGFDLYVNRGGQGRQRRVGQLVWSGSRGTRLYLAGDRPLPGPLPWVEVE